MEYPHFIQITLYGIYLYISNLKQYHNRLVQWLRKHSVLAVVKVQNNPSYLYIRRRFAYDLIYYLQSV